ncbi:LuxR C-terminal-related transcriptional regulator, partial [Pseudomonas syringae]|uniref:LuxR C-terminal-related transcriptional regulator n=1 Tax=Pseudomonas syringae TaxID=317 RepID=UPI0034D45A7C
LIGKNIDPQEKTDSLVAIRQGEVVVKYKSGVSIFNESAVKALSPLTARQKQGLGLVAAGKTNKELAKDLGISPFTVRIH